MNDEKEVFSTCDIARICHVAPNTVWLWIKDGKVPVFKTGGGQSRVWRKDLIAFLKQLNIPFPVEVVEEYRRVLVVDDEEEIVRTITRLIKEIDVKILVESATDGFDAGRKVESFLPDLVILDLLLPGMDGFQICRSIRDSEEKKEIKILAVSGSNVEINQKKIMDAGADDFLGKPFNSKALSDKVISLLELPKQKR